MNQLVFFILFMTSQALFAQSYGPNGGYHKFDVDAECRLLADNVNVRDQPSTKGKVIANIPIGTSVKIKAVVKEELKLNGFKTNWFKVEFKSTGKKQTGYVWGGLIADAFTFSTDKKTCFLYGVANYAVKDRGEWEEEVVTFQVRVCKDHQQLEKIEFEVGGGLQISRSIVNLGDRGIAGVSDIIEYEVSQEMCAGFNAYYMLFWTGKKLHQVATLRPGGDAPYYASDELIFPKDENGVKGKIIRDEISGYYEEGEDGQEGEDVIENQKKVELVWTGKKLKQTKVLINKKYEGK